VGSNPTSAANKRKSHQVYAWWLAPAIAHKIQIQGENSPALRMLMSNVNAPYVNTTQLPLTMGSNFVKETLLALNKMVGLS